VMEKRFAWIPETPSDPGVKFRAALEALAYLIALGVRRHEQAGQNITRVTVSGGIARSKLMCEILATVLNRPLERLQSAEGPALGAAVTALAAIESYRRRQQGIAAPYTVGDAVTRMVKFGEPATPNAQWHEAYRAGLSAFESQLTSTPAP
jgi:xylulokinase